MVRENHSVFISKDMETINGEVKDRIDNNNTKEGREEPKTADTCEPSEGEHITTYNVTKAQDCLPPTVQVEVASRVPAQTTISFSTPDSPSYCPSPLLSPRASSALPMLLTTTTYQDPPHGTKNCNQCRICGKALTHKDSLEKHKDTHIQD